jgi:phosphonate metabolism-associated iron-containing alcohol dehydrogenase
MIESWSNKGNKITYFGENSLLKNFKEITGKNILLICTPRSIHREEIILAKANLKKNNTLFINNSTLPNPSVSCIEDIYKQYKNKNVDLIIAIGGGSVIDTAKVLAVAFKGYYPTILELINNYKRILYDKKIKLIAVPTTSGTGAEVTPFATVWDYTNNRKISFAEEIIIPDIIILDPIYCKSVPQAIRLDCALDAFSHSLESLWNKNRNSISTIFSIKALEIMTKTLPLIISNNITRESTSQQMLASYYSGIAISETKTAIAHAVSYPLTAKHGLPHGIACSFTLLALLNDCKEHLVDLMGESLFYDVQKILESVDFTKRINEFMNKNDIPLHIKEMSQPGRADNYIGNIDESSIITILKNSL